MRCQTHSRRSAIFGHVKSVLGRVQTLAILLPLAVGLSPHSAAAQDSTAKNLTLLAISSATVAPSGLGFLSLSLSPKRVGKTRILDDADGSLAFGIGLGNAQTSVGVQLTAQITSLTDTFGDSGYFSIKLSRLVSRGKVPVYIGAEVSNLLPWGDAKHGGSQTVITNFDGVQQVTTTNGKRPINGKVMVTAFPTLHLNNGTEIPLMITLGYGDHLKNNASDPAPYFGIGAGFTRNFGASIAWTGDTVDLGASFRVNGWENGNISFELNDVTNRKGRRRVSVNFVIYTKNLF